MHNGRACKSDQKLMEKKIFCLHLHAVFSNTLSCLCFHFGQIECKTDTGYRPQISHIESDTVMHRDHGFVTRRP